MDMVGLQHYHARRYPHEFSGGQRQRIGIARALVLEPDLVVCDEPVSALDVSIQAQVLNLLRNLQRELGLTYVFVAHNMGVVEHISDRVAVMYLGRIAELADRRDLFAKQEHPYTSALMSAIPVPDPEQRRQRVILTGDVPSPVNPPTGCRFHPRCPLRKELGDPAICAESVPPLIDLGDEHLASLPLPWAVRWDRLDGSSGVARHVRRRTTTPRLTDRPRSTHLEPPCLRRKGTPMAKRTPRSGRALTGLAARDPAPGRLRRRGWWRRRWRRRRERAAGPGADHGHLGRRRRPRSILQPGRYKFGWDATECPSVNFTMTGATQGFVYDKKTLQKKFSAIVSDVPEDTYTIAQIDPACTTWSVQIDKIGS